MTYNPERKTRQNVMPGMEDRIYVAENGKWRHVYYMPYAGMQFDDFDTWEAAVRHHSLVVEQRVFM